MITHTDEHLDLCAGLTFGSLGERDQRRLQEHLLPGCATCEAALDDFSDSMVVVARSAPPTQPATALRMKLLADALVAAKRDGEMGDSVKRSIEVITSQTLGWKGWALLWASICLAILAMIFWGESSRLRGDLRESQGLVARLSREATELGLWDGALTAAGARSAVFEPTAPGSGLRARATYDPSSKRAVLVFDNLRTPADRDYQLWAMRGSETSSLGLIRPNHAGRAVMKLEIKGDPATLEGFAISHERVGGSPDRASPQGPIVMRGRLRR